jgi:general stress protein 26
MDDHATARDRAIAELERLVDGIPVAMVTTIAADAALRSRPMLVERPGDEGHDGDARHPTLIFLTHRSSHKASEIERDPRVNVAFVSDKGDRYVSVSGRATTAHDPARMKALWNPTYRAWFPGGPDDPDSAILTVVIDRVEYWDVPSSRLVRLWGVVRALATGEVAEAGEHETIVFGEDQR